MGASRVKVPTWLPLILPEVPKMRILATPKADAVYRNAKPKAKEYTIADGGGLYIVVTPSGKKLNRCGQTAPRGRALSSRRASRQAG